jgi:dTDP-4-dehydrorhamnose 3,5-epimerase
MPFEFKMLEIPGVILVKAQRFEDHRGFFMENYKSSVFAAHGIPSGFVQTNCSHSVRGVVRGLHYQRPPMAQGKLVMVPSGRIFDVAVDIRKGSPTYGEWVGAELSADNGHLLYVPAGFAHGFQVLSEHAKVIYMVTEEYSSEHDTGILWRDPEIGVEWPLPDPVLSMRDEQLPVLREADTGFFFG